MICAALLVVCLKKANPNSIQELAKEVKAELKNDNNRENMLKLTDLIKSELWRSRSIVLTVLSLFLGSFFILMGTLKLTPMISLDIHRELRRNYIRFAKLIPFLSYFGLKLSPKLYRNLFGLLELINGIILALVPFKRAKIIANILLLLLSVFSMFNNYLAGYKFDRKCLIKY